MDLTPHLEAVRADLESLADEQTLAGLARLSRAVEPSLQLRLLDVLCEAALELSGQLPGGHAEVRVAARDANLVFVPEGPAAREDATPEEEDEGGTSRLTLRMPDALKNKVEAAAAKEGLSVNGWLVRTIARGVEGRRLEIEFGKSKRGSRVTGWAE
ncbi:MAG: toxin-antitoxin system HicB family antitoxin [Actinomycetota bacterium]